MTIFFLQGFLGLGASAGQLFQAFQDFNIKLKLTFSIFSVGLILLKTAVDARK